MGIENSQGHGSMFGVVDSLNNLASAMTELLQFLPEDFVLADDTECVAIFDLRGVGT